MKPTANNAESNDWLARRTRYRRVAFGSLVVGIVGFVLADVVNAPVVGVGVYWVGFVGFFAVRRWAPMTLFDERDCALERQASYDTLRLAAVGLVLLAPTAATLEEIGYYNTPPLVEGVLWGYAGLFAVFGVAYLARRYRP